MYANMILLWMSVEEIEIFLFSSVDSYCRFLSTAKVNRKYAKNGEKYCKASKHKKNRHNFTISIRTLKYWGRKCKKEYIWAQIEGNNFLWAQGLSYDIILWKVLSVQTSFFIFIILLCMLGTQEQILGLFLLKFETFFDGCDSFMTFFRTSARLAYIRSFFYE